MTGITYRVGYGRNLSASEVDGNFSQLSANKVETSVYSALAASVMSLAAISGASAGTTQLTAGTLAFGDSNGVSFGLSGSILTATVRTDYLTTAAQSGHTHGVPTLVLTNLSGTTASNSAGLTLSLSAAAPGAGAALSASGSSQSGGTVVFSNSNGLSFGMSGSTITAAHNALTSQTVQTQGAVQVQGSTGAIVFSNSNGITFGGAGSTLTASHNGLTTAALSNHSHGNPTLALTNLSGSTASNSAGLTISLSALPPDGIGISAAAGTQTANSGVINFANSNGMTFGMSGSSQITASYSVPSTAGLLSAVNVSAGTTSQNLSAFTLSNSNGLAFGLNGSVLTGSYTVPGATAFSNSNNVSFGLAGSTVTASASFSQSVQTQNTVALQGSTGALSFSNSNGITFGFNASTITASHNGITSQSVQTQGLVQPAAGTQTATSGTVVFANSNGLSFGMSGSSQITASYTVPSTAGLLSAINISGGTTSNNLSAVTFANANGVSFGMNGSVLTASVAAVAGAQTGISGIANSETTYSSGTVGYSALGALTIRSTTGQQFQFSVAPQSAQTQSLIAALYDGAASISTGTVRLSNANGITFGLNGQTLTASHNGITSQSVQTQGSVLVQGSSGAVVFSNSNGITFGGNASTITASYTVPGATVFSNLNNVTFGLNGSTVTASASNVQSVQTQNVVAPSAGTQTATSGTVVFANSNGISFGMSGSSQITASYTVPNVPAQTAQTLGIYGSSQTYGQSSSSTVDARSLSFVGSGGISVGLSAGSVLISGQTTAAQSVQTQSTVAVQGSTGAISFSNSNGITFGFNASTITASHNGITSQTVQTQSVVQGISAGTQVGRTGDIVFSNSNGISFGLSGSNTLTASYTVPSTAGLISAVNLSAGTTSGNLSAVVFSNANGLSFGLNGSTVTGSHNALTTARASNDAIGLNTAQTNVTWTVNSSGLSFNAAGYAGTGTSNTGGAAFTLNSNGLQFNGSNLAGTTSGFTGANVSATITHNTAGLALSMSVAPAGAATLTAYAVSNTTQSTSGTIAGSVLSFQGNGGVSVGISGGSVVVSGPALTSLSVTGALSASSNGNTISLGVGTVTASIVGNTTQTSTGTINLNALVFSGAGGVSAGISAGTVIISGGAGAGGVALSAAGSSQSGGTVVFSNLNGVSFGMNGSTVTGSVVQSAQTVGLYAVSNTTGASSSSTADARSLSFQGAGVVSVGMSGGSVVISAPSAAASPVNFSAGTTSGNLGSVVFSNANGVSFGLNGSTITASAAGGGGGGVNIAASNTTYTSGTVVMSANGGALTISSGAQSVLFSVPATSSLVGASGIELSTNGSTVSIYQPDVSYFANAMYLFNSQSQTVQQNTSIVFPMQLQEGVSAGFMRMAHSVSLASTSFASTAASAYSYNQQETHNVVMYSLGTGASSMSLQSFWSSSVSFRFSINVSQNTTNNISVTHGLTYPVSNGTSTLSFSYAATNSTMQVSTTHMTALSGMKLWDTQFAGRMGGGRVYMAYGQSTSQTTQGTANLSACRLVHSHIGISQPNNTIGLFGVANSASNMWQQGLGSYTNAGATTASIDLSQISSSASHVVPYLQMLNNA